MSLGCWTWSASATFCVISLLSLLLFSNEHVSMKKSLLESVTIIAWNRLWGLIQEFSCGFCKCIFVAEQLPSAGLQCAECDSAVCCCCCYAFSSADDENPFLLNLPLCEVLVLDLLCLLWYHFCWLLFELVCQLAMIFIIKVTSKVWLVSLCFVSEDDFYVLWDLTPGSTWSCILLLLHCICSIDCRVLAAIACVHEVICPLCFFGMRPFSWALS